MATINTRILLRYDTYENWSKTDVELKGGNFVLKKGEVGFCEVPSDNTAATTAPTVLFKVGDGTNAFKDLKWASALAADVYSWAKENKITIVKNGTGNVISNIEWDTTANNGKGGIKFSTIDVYTKTESDNLYAQKQNASGGFEGGLNASAGSGIALGANATATGGSALGANATATTGGAIGFEATTSSGFAGGSGAKTISMENGSAIDAIQLGTGTNSTEKSLQVYDYTLMNPDGSIPAERLTNAATPEELERLNYYGNKDIVPSDESWFTVNAAGNTITGLTDTGKAQSGTLVIPYKINGKIITSLTSDNYESILAGALDKFTKVILPNSIKSIDSDVFSGCTALTSINIPNSVTIIGSGVFAGCTALVSIEIPSSITDILTGTFGGCTSLKSISISNSITLIDFGAFQNCTLLNKIEIPASVTYIDEDAFSGITPSNLTVYCEQGSYAETYASNKGFNIVYTDVSSNIAALEELERLQYYGDKDIIPSDKNYFTVNATGETITGLTETGKTQTELVIPYKINGKIITNIDSNSSFKSVITNNVTKVILPSSITNIGNFAFSMCNALISINIPNTITSIGDYAFYECRSLESINIPDSLTSIGANAFANCTGLKSIDIPNSLTSIGASAFSGCTMLTSINIPNSVTSIGASTFSGCTLLTEINIPNNITSIEAGTYANCRSLTSINIPNSVTSIGANAFINIPSSQCTIYCEQGSYAETYAKENGFNVVYTDVSNIATPEELERLQYYGDKNIIPSDESYFVVNETGETITGLTDAGKTQTELVIPYEINGKKITTLYSEVDHMFEPQSILDGSTTITKVTIPKSVTTLGRGVFDHCTSLASINIPDSVKTIDEYAFTYCTSLTSIKLPNSITTIGENAFNNCSGLTSIEIANGIKSIGAAMFSLCSNLETIYIPDSIASIGEDAFNGCTSLKRINIPKAVTQLGEFTFDGATNLTIYCEKGAYAENYAEIFNIPVVYTDISKETIDNLSSKEELERLQYYGDANIVPNESYFTVNGSTITGLTETGKTQTGTLVIPYKINGIEITQLQGNIISFTSILNGATDKITKVILPNSINNIGVASFYGCTALTEINIPDSVTNIQNYAFNGCTSLASINISNSVKNIGLVAFQGCTNLKIYCEQGSYAENYAKDNGFGNIVYTDIKSTYFDNYVSKDGSNTITGTIDATAGSISVSEPTSDTQAANKKYVDDSITAGIQANDAMTFKGLLGGEGNITELPTDIATVRNGDTYKVAVDGTYNEIAAKSGDMFIALVKNSTVSWQFIPSADDGNVLANNDLTADALIVGNGSKEIKTLDNGSNDQILRIVNNVPAWEKEYEVVASDTSITVTKDTENKQYKVSVNSIEVSKLTQTDGTVLILNGGNSAN